MFARCMRVRSSELAAQDAEHMQRHVHLDQVNLALGRDYVIFGVLFREGRPWFLVCEEVGDAYPKPHYAGLFELVDARVPPDWQLVLDHVNVGAIALLPRAWASAPRFMEQLVDGEPASVAAFEQLKQRLAAWHQAG